MSAVQHESEQILEEMLKRGVEPLGASLAAERGNVHVVNMLLSYGEDELNTEGSARNGQLESLKLLLEHGAEPDGLELAILHGHDAVAKLLLDSGADPNEITRLSLRHFDDVDFPSSYKFEYLTPLHYAVLNKSSELVNALLEAGADPNFFNEYVGGHMYTPTALTLMNGDVENFKRFIEAGAHTSESLVSWFMKIALVGGLNEAIEIL